jgi:hypothetical protein
VFEFGGLRDRQRDCIDWVLKASLDEGVAPDDVLTDEAATLLAAKLKTPLQIGQHLVRAFEAGMDGVCLGRKWKPSPRSSRRPWKGRNSYRRGDTAARPSWPSQASSSWPC